MASELLSNLFITQNRTRVNQNDLKCRAERRFQAWVNLRSWRELCISRYNRSAENMREREFTGRLTAPVLHF